MNGLWESLGGEPRVSAGAVRECLNRRITRSVVAEIPHRILSARPDGPKHRQAVRKRTGTLRPPRNRVERSVEISTALTVRCAVPEQPSLSDENEGRFSPALVGSHPAGAAPESVYRL
jgi:hypothetical protein